MLTQTQRKVLTKKTLRGLRNEGKTYKEIGKILKLKPAAVYYQYWKLGLVPDNNRKKR